MENSLYLLILTLYAVSAIICGNIEHDEPKQRCVEKNKYYGCIYFKTFDKCFCTTRRACKDPFIFKSQQQCIKNALKQKGACKRYPCENQAKCTSIKSHSRYTCDCTGTGFYGKRCHKACPKASDISIEWLRRFSYHKNWKNTPIACVIPRKQN